MRPGGDGERGGGVALVRRAGGCESADDRAVDQHLEVLLGCLDVCPLGGVEGEHVSSRSAQPVTLWLNEPVPWRKATWTPGVRGVARGETAVVGGDTGAAGEGPGGAGRVVLELAGPHLHLLKPRIGNRAQQPVHVKFVRCRHINLAVGDNRWDKAESRAGLISAGDLCGVVKLVRQIGCIVSVQNRRAAGGGSAVIQRPHDPVCRAVGGDAWCCAVDLKNVSGLGGRRGRKQPICKLVRLEGTSRPAIVHLAVEVSGSVERASRQRIVDLLYDVVAVRVEFAHVVTIDHVDRALLP